MDPKGKGVSEAPKKKTWIRFRKKCQTVGDRDPKIRVPNTRFLDGGYEIPQNLADSPELG